MHNDEHVFDYMAAAEEAGRQLDSLVKQVPGHIKSSLAASFTDEWRKVTAFKELAEATGKLNDAIGEVRESVALLRQTIWAVAIFGVVVPVVFSVFGRIMGN
jgi:hypothetical protein